MLGLQLNIPTYGDAANIFDAVLAENPLAMYADTPNPAAWDTNSIARNLVSAYSLESPGTDRVTDGGFVNGLTSWPSVFGTPTTREVVDGRFHIVSDATQEGGGQLITRPADGLTYRLRLDYEVVSGSLWVLINSSTNYSNSTLTGTGSLDVLFTHRSANLHVILRTIGVGEFYVDNVSMEVVGSLDANLTDIDLGESVYVPLEENLLANEGFDADTDWVKGTGWSIGSGVASCNGAQSGVTALNQVDAMAGVPDDTPILVQYEISNHSAGAVTPYVSGNSSGVTRSANGSYSEVVTHNDAADNFFFLGDADFTADIDNVSARQLVVVPGVTAFGSNALTSLMTVFNNPTLANLDSFTIVVGAVVNGPGENNAGRFFAWGNEEHEGWIDSTGALNLEIDRATSNDSSASPAATVEYGEMGLFVFECANGIADLQYASNSGTLADVGTRSAGSGSVVDETTALNLLNLGDASATLDATVVFIAIFDNIDQNGLDSIAAAWYDEFSGLVA